MPRRRTAVQQLVERCHDSPRPIYLLDLHRTIVYCNEACAAWVGVAADALVGEPCLYAALPEAGPAQAAAARLCPPPEVLAGLGASGWVSACRGDGTPVLRTADFLPLGTPDEPAGLLVVVAVAGMANLDAPPTLAEATAEQLHLQLARLRHHHAGRYNVERLLGTSPAAVRVRSQVLLACSAPAQVLIVGPSGSGKDHVAKSIHYRGQVGEPGALVPIACSALDPELLVSTLQAMFAKSAQRRADRPATLVLGDVDHLPAAVQDELVRLLRPATELRLVATATRPLAELVAQGQFRADLAALLSTLVIELVPLAQRIEDLPLLAQALVEEVNAEGGRQRSGFAPEAFDLLSDYAWPGNLDELAELVRAAHAQAAGPLITPRDLPKRIHLAADAAQWPQRVVEPIDLTEVLQRVETELIERALERAKGNKSRAAELLGLTRPRLYRRLVQLGLEQNGAEPTVDELPGEPEAVPDFEALEDDA